MEQNYDGSSRVSDSEILSPTSGNYLVAPQWMDMEMHMFGLMISPIDHLTLMLMIPYASKEMGHLRRDGVEFLTKSEGWGDLKLSGIYELYHGHRTTWLLNLGLSLPTGSTSEEDFIPGPGETRLPYPMQIGSGTWDLLPGITYLEQADTWSWGAQLSGVIRLGENDEGYTLGNVGQLTAWGAYTM
ncbi:transporter [Verrucomicrobiales bacterium]|nr:transporter [Verrucomicrobiales bacterium]